MSWYTARFLSYLIISPLYLSQVLRLLLLFYFSNAMLTGTSTLSTNIITIVGVCLFPFIIPVLEIAGRVFMRHVCDTHTHVREMQWRTRVCLEYTAAMSSDALTLEKVLFGAVLLSLFTGVMAGLYANSTIGIGTYDLMGITVMAIEFILHITYASKRWSEMILRKKASVKK
jgi:hypothetical protein